MVIDWSRVAELHEDFGDDTFEEILDVFVAETEEAVARLRDAPTHQTMQDEFHFLKGAALNLGLAAMAKLCSDGESHARDGADCAELRSQVLTAYPAHCQILITTWAEKLKQ